MKTKKLKSNLILLLTAAIWGFAFTAQRVSMNYIGAFTFNGIRFAIGAASLIPIIIFFDNKKKKENKGDNNIVKENISVVKAGIIVGIIIFLGSSFQQVGMGGTTAGKAAFITGLYIVIVPILGIFLKQYIGIKAWMGAIVAVVGLYFLCVTENFSISHSDFLELFGSFFFAIHILLIDHYSSKVDGVKLAFCQFVTCSILSTIIALFSEKIVLNSILGAAISILYAGILSSGVAYTLQIIGQKNAEPSEASIVMSTESVFGALGGFIILHENLGAKGIIGCILMFIGMILSQLKEEKKEKKDFKFQNKKKDSDALNSANSFKN